MSTFTVNQIVETKAIVCRTMSFRQSDGTYWVTDELDVTKKPERVWIEKEEALKAHMPCEKCRIGK